MSQTSAGTALSKSLSHNEMDANKTGSPLESDASPKTSDEASNELSVHGSPCRGKSFDRKYRGWAWFSVCAAVYTSAFLYGLDTTIVADIQSAAVETFGNVEKLGWLGIGFPLGSVATILAFSKAYCTFDLKWLYIGSLVMFEAGSALCGASPTMDVLIVGRVWAGSGGAGMYLGALNILTLSTSETERPLYMSLTGLFWGTGCILGPVIGGAFADSSATWRWAFYINLVLFALMSPIILFVLDSNLPQPGISLKHRLRRMDWLGLLINAAVYVFLCMPLTLGGTIWSWTDHRMIILYVLFFVSLIAFIITQKHTILTNETDRLFPIDFLRRRTIVLLFVTMCCLSTALFVPIYYIPLYSSFVYGYNGTQSAVSLLPFICIAVFVIMLNGYYMPRFGYYQPWYVASFVFTTIGGSLMYSLVNAGTPQGTIYGFSVLLALGAGFAATAGYSVAPIKVEQHRVPDVIGFINTAQIGAAAIALTISSAVFQNLGYRYVATAVQGLDFTQEDIHAALSGANSAILQTVPAAVRHDVLDAIVSAITKSYALTIAAGGLGLVSSLLMRPEKIFM